MNPKYAYDEEDERDRARWPDEYDAPQSLEQMELFPLEQLHSVRPHDGASAPLAGNDPKVTQENAHREAVVDAKI